MGYNPAQIRINLAVPIPFDFGGQTVAAQVPVKQLLPEVSPDTVSARPSAPKIPLRSTMWDVDETDTDENGGDSASTTRSILRSTFDRAVTLSRWRAKLATMTSRGFAGPVFAGWCLAFSRREVHADRI